MPSVWGLNSSPVGNKRNFNADKVAKVGKVSKVAKSGRQLQIHRYTVIQLQLEIRLSDTKIQYDKPFESSLRGRRKKRLFVFVLG